MVMTYRELLKAKAAELAEQGVENSGFDCGELLGKALMLDCRSAEFRLRLDDSADKAVSAAFGELCQRRAKGEPLQYIIGEWEFCGLPFKVGRGVLIPRQDTETLVELAVNKYKNTDSITLIDLCTGSGCIAIALEKQLDCHRVIGVEHSQEAAEFFSENVKLNCSSAELITADVLDDSTPDRLPDADLIVCNPPYLTADDMAALQREVSHEPAKALYGGEDGLDFYRGVTRLWKNKLKEGGTLIYEIGAGQEDEVMGILIQHGFTQVRCRRDAAGINRCVLGIYDP